MQEPCRCNWQLCSYEDLEGSKKKAFLCALSKICFENMPGRALKSSSELSARSKHDGDIFKIGQLPIGFYRARVIRLVEDYFLCCREIT